MSPPPLMQKDADMPRALDRWSHLSPWPLNTRISFGPKTRMMVVVVDSCVRTNPSRYLISGPACGKIKRLRKSIEKDILSKKWRKLQHAMGHQSINGICRKNLLNSNYHQFCLVDSFKYTVFITRASIKWSFIFFTYFWEQKISEESAFGTLNKLRRNILTEFLSRCGVTKTSWHERSKVTSGKATNSSVFEASLCLTMLVSSSEGENGCVEGYGPFIMGHKLKKNC